MKKTYISPALAMYSLHIEQNLLLTMSASSSEGNTITTDTEWDTNKKEPAFGGSMWDNMEETGNF
ncbi:MAG: hypothetical protein ACI3X6_08050 [Alloprevotella sp.]